MAATVGTRGWEARPWQSKASLSLRSASLSTARMLELAAEAARGLQDDRGWVSVRDRSTARVDLRVRDLTRTDGEAVMLFHVEAAHAAGRVTARTAVDEYQMKDTGLAGLVAVANRKVLGYSAYERYMDAFGALVVAADPEATVSFTSGK